MKLPILTLVLVVPALLAATLAGPVRAEDVEDPVEAAMNKPTATGLLVTSVGEESQANEAGILPGDILTHYDGKPTGTLEDLMGAKTAAAEKELVVLSLVRAGETVSVTMGAGQIGINVMPVTEGKAVPPLPKSTVSSLDFTSLKDAPRDEWLAFALADGKKVGFEHHMLRLEDGKLHLRREVAFDGSAGGWGLNHMDATVVATAKGVPETLRTIFASPLPDGQWGEWRGELEVLEDGSREWKVTWEMGEESGAAGGEAPPRMIAEYLIESVAAFMPFEKGACLHFRPIGETQGEASPTAALLVAGPEDYVLDGKTIKVWRVQRLQRGAQVASTFLVDASRRVVHSDYMGAQATLTTKEKALAGLHKGLKPRTAE